MKNISQGKHIHLAAALMAAAACIAMVIFPAMALDSARKGVALWVDTVLPALLPFFICANFMIALGVPRVMGRVFEKPFQKLFGVSGISAFIFCISATSGYPMGPTLIGDMARKGDISRREARGMLTFCSTSGPLFMLGAVGAGMLGSPEAGFVIAFSHYAGALLNGILWRFLGTGEDEGRSRGRNKGSGRPPVNVPREGLLESLTQSILSALRTVGIICCYLILFTMITDFLQFSGVFRGTDNELVRVFVNGILEMTVGCNQAAMTAFGNLTFQTVLCTFFIAFGGLSIMAQSMSMLSGAGVSPGYYLQVKFTHGVLAAAIAFLTGHFFLGLSTQAVFLSLPVGALPQIELGFLSQILFSTGMMVFVIFLFVCSILADRVVKWYNKANINES